MIPLPFIAGGLAIGLGLRILARRRERSIVRLRDGRRVRLLSSVALMNGSATDLLALEYRTAMPDPAPEELGLEARSLVQTIGARAEYAACRTAVVTARPARRAVTRARADLSFSFRRGDSGLDWYPTERLDA
jgi:hypothetical protein